MTLETQTTQSGVLLCLLKSVHLYQHVLFCTHLCGPEICSNERGGDRKVVTEL